MTPPPRLRHVRHRGARGANGGIERLIERLLPELVRRLEQAGAAAEADVVDEDVDAAEASRPSARRAARCLPRRGEIRLHGEHRVVGPAGGALARSRAASSSRAAPRAQMTTEAPFGGQRLRAAPARDPRLDPVTMATLPSSCKSTGAVSLHARSSYGAVSVGARACPPVRSFRRQSYWPYRQLELVLPPGTRAPSAARAA